MSVKARPAWAVHLKLQSPIPLDNDAARRFLRRGALPEGLLQGGTAPALKAGDLALSHDQLRSSAVGAALRLAEAAVTKGIRVAIFAESSAAWIINYLGLQLLGAIVVGMNPAYKRLEAEHILSDSEAELVLVDDARQPLVEALRLRLPNLKVLRLSHGAAADQPAAKPPAPRAKLDSESPALLIYTSGTTGRPKGALLDHGNLLAQARGVVEAWRWTPEDRLVLALPLFHIHGLGIALHGSLIAGGCAVVVPFTPENVVRELQASGTMFFGVPAMYQRLCDYLEQHPTDLSHVRLFVSGSAPLPVPLFERCKRLLGQPVLERYGITEGGIVVSNPYEGPRQPGRVGYPLPGVAVRLGDRDEVQLKGGQVFSGYWRNDEASCEAFVDGWLRTGDVGEIGGDGTLAIRGRIKELIISGGYNVYPREVEAVLEQHPAIAEVAVTGLPSERWGEEVTAFVVARNRVEADDLIAYSRERLATYKCPRAVRFIDALPRNAMGKVERSRLQ
jgi:malonyl-CoA/methylmalonyl-CoA synthetase